MTRLAKTVVAMALLCALVAPVSVFAQMAPLWTMATVDVKSNMTQEFEQLQKELSAAYKEAGVETRLVFQTLRGPSSRYYISDPHQKFADLDQGAFMAKTMGEAAAARWIARVTKCIVSRRVDTLEFRDDLSVPDAEGELSPMMVWIATTNLPGRYPDYNQFLTEKWIPSVKDAGMTGVFTFRNRFGGNRRQWYTAIRVDDWSVFDGPHPVQAKVGPDAFGQMMGESGSMTETPIREVIRLRPELSIVQQ